MYIIYKGKEDNDFGIWEISDDMTTQTCVYYSDGCIVDKSDKCPLDNCLTDDFVEGCEEISILTRDQALEFIFLNE